MVIASGASRYWKDRREAVEEAIDCLGSVIAFRIAEKKEIPAPSPLKRGQRLVPVPLWIAGTLALYLAMREQGVNNSELARRLGVRETVVRRMLDPEHETRSEKLLPSKPLASGSWWRSRTRSRRM